MLKFLFVISFGFGIPTKYSDSLKHFFFELVQSWCAIFLDWGPACMSLLSWNPGSMKQRCAGISSVSWPCFEILILESTWSRIGYYSVLWSENNMNTVYTIYTNLYPSVLHLFAPVSLFHADRFFIGRDHWNHGDTMEWIESSGSPTLESGDT